MLSLLCVFTDGSEKRDAITDAALKGFRAQYGNKKITKWDIFHYTYAILHHPGYQSSFSEALKRDLPRIPYAPDFSAFAKAGTALANLHLGYEELDPWPLEWVQSKAERLNYRVDEKMRLSKTKDALWVNSSLSLSGIPPEALLYRMGSRSPLEWLIDQYQVTNDPRSGIKFDPNRKGDQEYVIRSIGRSSGSAWTPIRLSPDCQHSPSRQRCLPSRSPHHGTRSCGWRARSTT